jgi:hypothetical protein
MSDDASRTDRWPLAPDTAVDGDHAGLAAEAEALFADFVRNANALGADPHTVRVALRRVAAATDEALLPDEARPADATAARPGPEPLAAAAPEAPGAPRTLDPERVWLDGRDVTDPGGPTLEIRAVVETGSGEILVMPPEVADAVFEDAVTAPSRPAAPAAPVPLVARKSSPGSAAAPRPAPDPFDTQVRAPAPRELPLREPAPGGPSASESTAPGLTTQRREAAAVVPAVARIKPAAPPPRERVEDGQMPSGELDRTLADFVVLLRWGHAAQVRAAIEDLRRAYPADLLLLRRIAEFHLESGHGEEAMEVLFTLASRLFERRNVEGMRAALEQILVLDPDNARARRLYGLLAARASSP